VIGAILSKLTQQGRIILLGNVLPIHDNPLRLAEEIAMMDIISGGRIVSGFVRGIGIESLANNANPVFNRERFEEAHDLIVKAWTTPGPFRWEGKHFHYRVVNPWMVPIQKPHPPVWVPGIASPETIMWAARHRYPYVALNTSLEITPRMWQLYADTAAEAGYAASDDNYGYVMRICVADTDEQAYEQGRHFYWQLGRTFGRVPLHWQRPSGYVSRSARTSQHTALRDAFGDIGYEQAQEVQQVITGTPDTVIAKLKRVIDVVHPAWLVLWAREGPMAHAAAMRCLELLGKEVIPAIKEYQPQVAA
jgi:alkanesulfonate monooxygenase SsuD/methylene tetrahydromethanopterin reductase-like flavin-dependent oxidoreductase (luciferase family)